jgi:hypothetical protein
MSHENAEVAVREFKKSYPEMLEQVTHPSAIPESF